MRGHGEYKVPGGKLVVADVVVACDQLTDVALSGDFFLEPDTALAVINAALRDRPVDLAQEAMERIIHNCLPPDVRMYGVDAAGFAVAVRRAIEGRSGHNDGVRT